MAVACGRTHTVVLTEYGRLCVWGPEDCGEANSGNYIVDEVYFSSVRFVMVSAGWYFFAAVDGDGVVWIWGNMDNHSENPLESLAKSTPKRLTKEDFGGSPAVMVACGCRYMTVVTEDGQVWCFECCFTAWRKKLVQHGEDISVLIGGHKKMPTLVQGYIENAHVVMVATGAYHCIVATSGGDVYTWGLGKYGVLGHNTEEDKNEPTRIDESQFGGSMVSFVAAGAYHSVAVTVEGRLFVWGCGDNGQLGLGESCNRLSPTVLNDEAFGGSRVRMVACGDDFTLTVTEEGSVWSCGYGRDGNLGLDDRLDEYSPIRVDRIHFKGADIMTAAAGSYVSMAVTKDGDLYSWGSAVRYNKSTGIGHKDMEDKVVPTYVKPHVHNPSLLVPFDDRDLFYLEANSRIGAWHSLLLEHVVAFTMGLHWRLGSTPGQSTDDENIMKTRSLQGEIAHSGSGKQYSLVHLLDDNLVRMILDLCTGFPAGGAGELPVGVVKLIGGVF